MARVVLDASVLIALWDRTNPHHKWAIDFFNTTLEWDLAVSALTQAELLVRPVKNGTQVALVNSLAGLNLEFLAIKADDAAAIAGTQVEHNLKLPDAVVLHAALSSASALATCEQNLFDVARSAGLKIFGPN